MQSLALFFRNKKGLTTAQILEELDRLASQENVGQLDVYMIPPDDDGGQTDCDSGEEDTTNPDHFSYRQLNSEAELVINRNHDELDSDLIEIVGPTNEDPGPSNSTFQPLPLIQQQSNNRLSGIPLVTTPKTPVVPRKWGKYSIKSRALSNWIKPPPGSVISLSESSHPVEFYELFMNYDIMQRIVHHTVNFATFNNNPQFVLSVEELHNFIGILILSGYVPLPRRRLFWDQGDDCHNTMVSKSMRRNRFEEIFRYLHVVDIDDLVVGDKMAKVRPLLDALNDVFLTYAPIEKDISIDESMIPYFGRHGCKQFIRGKPIRYGFKAWVAATRLGYCLYADLYQGRKVGEKQQQGLGESVVINLIQNIKNRYPGIEFSLYCDNFFTSPRLISKLNDINVLYTGTVRANRTEKCPLTDISVIEKKKRGTYDWRTDRKDKIWAVRWNDNNVVTLMSSEYGLNPINKAKRYSAKDKSKIEIPQPNIVAKYNRYMGGVDQLDSNVATYRIAIRGKKWYIPIIFWMIDVCINNACLLARSFGGSVDTLNFRRQIATTLLMKYGTRRIKPGPNRLFKIPLPVRKHNAEHLIIVGQKRRRCSVCHNKTTKACMNCGVALHDKCFANFHA